jgi:membrane associated rhomboid family serine protease
MICFRPLCNFTFYFYMDIDMVTIAIIAMNVIVSSKGFNDASFFRKYEFHIGSIRAGEHYRMFTSAFLHADLSHLMLNMITLFFFAPVVVSTLGTVSFLLVYFASLFAGSLLTLFFHKNDYAYRAIGASGAVVGILFASVLIDPDRKINFFIPGYIFAIFYLLVSIYGMKSKRDNIGHTAHFGGAIGGYFITLTKIPNVIYDRPLVVIGMAIPIVVLFILARMGKL